MLESILAVGGLVVLIVLLVVMFCWFANLCFGSGSGLGGFLNYMLFGRDAMEACIKGIGWCIYAICMIISDSNRS
jgi:hypothetical protein